MNGGLIPLQNRIKGRMADLFRRDPVFSDIFSQTGIFSVKWRALHVVTRLLQIRLVAVSMAAIGLLGISQGQPGRESAKLPNSDSTPTVILEVVNNHFTVGRKIPSIYLRLFSDGTAECHALDSTEHEQGTVRKGRLTPNDFEKTKAVLARSGLRDVNGRYDLPRTVIDSWMEWDLRSHDSLRHDVTVSFGPEARYDRPFPEALRDLACQILTIREYIYGDSTGYYRPACQARVDHP